MNSPEVYLSFFEAEKGNKREKALTLESNPNISISVKYVHRLLCCMFSVFSSETASCELTFRFVRKVPSSKSSGLFELNVPTGSPSAIREFVG